MSSTTSKCFNRLLFGLTDSLLRTVGAWGRRQRTYLEQKPWKSILDTDAPTSQASLNRILGIIASLPGLLEDSDRIRADQAATPSANQDEAISFRNHLVEFVGELFIWRWDWECIHPQGASEITVDPTVSSSVDENGIPLYRTVFFYSGIHQGKQLLIYNSALLVALELANGWNVEDAPRLALSNLRNQGQPSRSNPLVLPHHALSSLEVYSEICRSIEYFLQEPHATVGAMFLLYLLRLLLNPPRVSMHRGWLSRITKTVADVCGAELSEESNAPWLSAEDVRNVGAPSAPPSTSAWQNITQVA
jgi:hypothetical protein